MKQNSEDNWHFEYSAEASVLPEVIWRIFSDVHKWKEWNAGIEEIEMQGPFAVGTEFLMTPPGQEPLVTQLIEVRENEAFVDETHVGDVVIVVAHRLEQMPSSGTRVTYTILASGPGCADVGQAVSSDFPQVLKSLVDLAESNLCGI